MSSLRRLRSDGLPRQWVFRLLASLLVGSFAVPSRAEEPASPAWKAASSQIVITPEDPMWMAGYAARTEPSQGVEQDLFAKALAVEDAGGTRLVIVTTDLIGIPRSLRDGILATVEERFQLPAESLVLNASHTHCGPELRVAKSSVYGLAADRVAQSRAYAEKLEASLIELIGATLAELQPARLTYSFARAGFAMNRRLPTAGGIRNSPYPQGPVDHSVPVLRVANLDGELQTILFGYACHNTTLSFQKFCGDYAGYAQADLETAHPGVDAMFLAGCGGDQNPYPRRTLQLAQDHGRALANAVETALSVAQPREVTGSLRLATATIDLPFLPPPSRETLTDWKGSANRYDRRRGTALLQQWDEEGGLPTTYPYPLSVAQFGGDLLLVTLAGEVVIDYARRLKQELAGDADVWVAAYSHDVFGYVPSRRVALEGGYEGGGAMRYTTLTGPFDPNVEQQIVQTIKRLAEQTADRH